MTGSGGEEVGRWPWSTATRRLFAERLREFPRRIVDEPDRREAAVAVALVPDAAGRTAFLLTLRAAHLPRHRGQFALPGGRLEEGETVRDAARRELAEELSVTVEDDDVLGCLDDYPTGSGWRITPVVLWGPDRPKVRPDPGEVARAFVVPLEELAAAVPESGRPGGPVPSLGIVGTRVFAPTAAMLVQFAEVVLRGRSTRVADFGEPFFARR